MGGKVKATNKCDEARTFTEGKGLKKKKSKNRIEKNIFNGDHLKKRNIF